jgi:hypothetical protein
MVFYKKNLYPQVLFFLDLPASFFFWICPQFFFKKKSLKLSRMGGFRRVQMGGLGAFLSLINEGYIFIRGSAYIRCMYVSEQPGAYI